MGVVKSLDGTRVLTMVGVCRKMEPGPCIAATMRRCHKLSFEICAAIGFSARDSVISHILESRFTVYPRYIIVSLVQLLYTESRYRYMQKAHIFVFENTSFLYAVDSDMWLGWRQWC